MIGAAFLQPLRVVKFRLIGGQTFKRAIVGGREEAYLFCGAFTMAALIFWSMKNNSDRVKPRPSEIKIPLTGKNSTWARSNLISARGGNFSTVNYAD